MLDSYHISRCRYKQNTLYQSGLNKFHSSNSPTQLGLDPKFKTYFHVVIPAPIFIGINSSRNPVFPSFSGLPLEFIPCLLRGGSDSDLGFFSNLLNHFAFGEPVFIRPAELGGIQQVFFINPPDRAKNKSDGAELFCSKNKRQEDSN
jgi:hypothetical protein